MSTNITSFPSFEYFDNSLTLFKLVEYHFPYADHISKIRASACFKESLPGLYIEAEKERLKERYPSLIKLDVKDAAQFGFASKIAGHDLAPTSLRVQFAYWFAFKYEEVVKMNKILSENGLLDRLRKEPSQKGLEIEYVQALAYGINDALYLEELNSYSAASINKGFIVKTSGRIFSKANTDIIKKKGNDEQSEVIDALVHYFKFNSEGKNPVEKLRKDYIAEGKRNFYNYLTQIKNGKHFTPKKLQLVIARLQDCLPAQQIAQKELRRLHSI